MEQIRWFCWSCLRHRSTFQQAQQLRTWQRSTCNVEHTLEQSRHFWSLWQLRQTFDRTCLRLAANECRLFDVHCLIWVELDQHRAITCAIKDDLSTTILVHVAFKNLTPFLDVTLACSCPRSANEKSKQQRCKSTQNDSQFFVSMMIKGNRIAKSRIWSTSVDSRLLVINVEGKGGWEDWKKDDE